MGARWSSTAGLRSSFGFSEIKGEERSGAHFPTSFCFDCGSVAWSCGSHLASKRTKVRTAEQKENTLQGPNSTNKESK